MPEGLIDRCRVSAVRLVDGDVEHLHGASHARERAGARMPGRLHRRAVERENTHRAARQHDAALAIGAVREIRQAYR